MAFPLSSPRSRELVEAIGAQKWSHALRLSHLARSSVEDLAKLDPFAVDLEVRCAVRGQSPWQAKLKTRAERCTGIYEPCKDELVNGRPCYKKVGSDKDGDGQVWLCFTSNGPGHERYMIQHVRVKGFSKGYARCKLTEVPAPPQAERDGSMDGGSPAAGGAAAERGGGGGGAVASLPAPYQVRLWQVHDGVDWSVCEEFQVLPVLPVPLLAALDAVAPAPCGRPARLFTSTPFTPSRQPSAPGTGAHQKAPRRKQTDPPAQPPAQPPALPPAAKSASSAFVTANTLPKAPPKDPTGPPPDMSTRVHAASPAVSNGCGLASAAGKVKAPAPRKCPPLTLAATGDDVTDAPAVTTTFDVAGCRPELWGLPAVVWGACVGRFLGDRDVAACFATCAKGCEAMDATVAARPCWAVVLAVLRADPKAAEQRNRSGGLLRDVACAKGAPWPVLDALVQLTPYGSLVEATHASAHRSHLAALIRASPLATSLSRLGFGPAEIGRLVGDATLGLSSAQDLKHVRYDELVRAGVTAVSARKAIEKLSRGDLEQQMGQHMKQQTGQQMGQPPLSASPRGGFSGGFRGGFSGVEGAMGRSGLTDSGATDLRSTLGSTLRSTFGSTMGHTVDGEGFGDGGAVSACLAPHGGGVPGGSACAACGGLGVGAASASAEATLARVCDALAAAAAASAARHASAEAHIGALAAHASAAAGRETELRAQVAALTAAVAALLPLAGSAATFSSSGDGSGSATLRRDATTPVATTPGRGDDSNGSTLAVTPPRHHSDAGGGRDAAGSTSSGGGDSGGGDSGGGGRLSDTTAFLAPFLSPKKPQLSGAADGVASDCVAASDSGAPGPSSALASLDLSPVPRP